MPTITELRDRVRAAGLDPAALLDDLSPERLAQLQRGEPIREDLVRIGAFTSVRDAGDGEAGGAPVIEGYGAVFNSPTEINSWEGHFEETIDPGAFKKSLREQRRPGGGTNLKMQFDHGHHPLLGGLPLGRWEIAEEDDHGLHLVGRAYDDWLRAPFVESIRDGGVDGMSFRFSVVKEKWTDKDGVEVKGEELFDMLFWGSGDRGPLKRTLREVKVTEAGPVVWPAYKDTSVGARSKGGAMVIDLGALRTDPRAAAYVLAQVDATMAAGMAPPLIGGGTRLESPEQRWQPIGVAGLAAMAQSLLPSQRVPDEAVVHNYAVVDTAASARSRSTAEPQPTGTPAATHSDTEPRGTEEPAGTHSATPAPTPRRSRAQDLKNRYRDVLNATLELPKS